MKHQCKSIFLIVCIALQHSGNLEAAVIFSQTMPEEPVGAFSSGNSDGNQIIANRFVLDDSGPALIRSLKFIGGYGLTSPPPITPAIDDLPNDIFTVAFFEDSAGSPGLPLPGGVFEVAQVVQRNPTGGELLNGVNTPVSYGVNLNDGIELNSSTPYWVSIANSPGDDHFWVWARAIGQDGSLLASTFGDIALGPWQTGAGGMWFELNTMPIPEPQSVLLLAGSISILWHQRRYF